MSFRITGLDPELFRHLYGMTDAELAGRGAERVIADSRPGFPDRVEVRDAAVGETLLLFNYVHQPANTPYRAGHAVFVREGAERAYDRVDEIPEALLIRPISLRAFSARHHMIDADLAEGEGLPALIERLLANPATAYLHAHYAKPGCYAALITRQP